MLIQNHLFTSEAETLSYIDECEAGYDREVETAVKAALAKPGLRFITLTGPTCSGKTTTADRFKALAAKEGKRLIVISIDDFYKNNGDGVDRVNVDHSVALDYDSVNALDLECLYLCAKGIEEGKRVYLPRFNFTNGFRSGYYTYDRDENDIIMLEGLQAIYPEVIALLPPEHTVRIYISVGDELSVLGRTFSRRDIRLIRRIVRDYNYRAASAEFTLYLWDGVVKNEDKNILPYVNEVPISINSLLGYEMNIIKRRFMDVTDSLGEESRYYGECQRLRGLIEGLPEIDEKYLPANSVYREFIKTN